jgi:hypothetical protein
MKYDHFRTHAKLTRDYEKRMNGVSCYSEYYPIAMIRLTLVDREVDNIVKDKKREQS